MRKLDRTRRALILTALVEGNSVNSTARLCGVSKLTVLRLLTDVGVICQEFHDRVVRGVRSRRVQCDEIWAYVGAKQKNVEKGAQGYGDAWTWVSVDADTKLCLAYLVGKRNAECAHRFMLDVAGRITTRVQLTTDGHGVYLDAVENAFGTFVDYAMLVKLYGPEGGPQSPERKYSPGKCNGTRKMKQFGKPDPDHVSTSYVERQNLTLRMANRRHTRLTNAFSKTIENHAHAIALHYWFYNFARKHMSLDGMTPACKAGVADRQYTMVDLVDMLEQRERATGGRINRADRT